MNTQALQLSELLEPVIEAMGYEFVGIECVPRHGHFTVCVYIDTDAEGGIQVDDCGQVSRQISGVLEVEDPIEDEYMLEVSSPGLDRPLFSRTHFERFAGEEVKISMAVPVANRRNFKGILQGLQNDEVMVEIDGTEYRLPYTSIHKARIVPDWDQALTDAAEQQDLS